MDRPLTPSETARRFGVTIKALRVYESRGLLTPLREGAGATRAQWRVYGPQQLARLHQILALKRMGLSLARIGEILAGPDTLAAVLALQADALAGESKILSQALMLVRKAQAKLAGGQALSIDDLATLSKETSMPPARRTQFHPALVPHQHKYFRPEELETLAPDENYDRERDYAQWEALIAELKSLAIAGDPASPASLDLGRRWHAQLESFTKGDQILTTKLRNMVKDAFADPATAQQMPYSKEDLMFLGRIFERLTAP